MGVTRRDQSRPVGNIALHLGLVERSPGPELPERLALAAAAWAPLPWGVLALDSAGACLACNPAASELLGQDPRAGYAQRCLLTVPVLQGLLPGAKADPEAPVRVGERWLRLQARPAGALPGVALLITIQDVTREVEVERELQRAQGLNRELEALLRVAHDHVCITDGSGRILHVTPSSVHYYGLTPQEMVGKTAQELQRCGVFTESATVMALRERREVVTIHETRQGGRLIIHAYPLFDASDHIHRVVCLCRDITEQSRLQQRLDEVERLVRQYRSELARVRSTQAATGYLVARSPALKTTLRLLERAALSDSTILLLGESGVGKEVLARHIHATSRRADRPFVKVNCGAIPEHLVESELFGYESGAFTGAKRGGKPGLLDLAHEGTLFLDEIGELPLTAQVKLLQVLQEKRFNRVGGTRTITSNFRLVAATNRDLEQMVREGKFREDLFYRLNVIPVHIPPLRERPEDIPPLIDHFLDQFGNRYGVSRRLAPRVFQQLMRHAWPGNVRELENLIERLVVTAEGAEVDLDDLAAIGWRPKAAPAAHGIRPVRPVEVHAVVPYRVAVRHLERQLLKLAGQISSNTYEMASHLGLNQSTVVRKLRRFWRADEFPVGPRAQAEP